MEPIRHFITQAPIIFSTRLQKKSEELKKYHYLAARDLAS
jgi:hypothetical protein